MMDGGGFVHALDERPPAGARRAGGCRYLHHDGPGEAYVLGDEDARHPAAAELAPEHVAAAERRLKARAQVSRRSADPHIGKLGRAGVFARLQEVALFGARDQGDLTQSSPRTRWADGGAMQDDLRRLLEGRGALGPNAVQTQALAVRREALELGRSHRPSAPASIGRSCRPASHGPRGCTPPRPRSRANRMTVTVTATGESAARVPECHVAAVSAISAAATHGSRRRSSASGPPPARGCNGS